MKVLTLTQPWATLVMLYNPAIKDFEKHFETRSWWTAHQGELGIHAAKGFPGWAKRQCFLPPFSTVLVAHNLSPDDLPLGKILGKVDLTDCFEAAFVAPEILSENERSFGDFSCGRFAWDLGDKRILFDVPIPARGSLGLWNWEPEEVAR